MAVRIISSSAFAGVLFGMVLLSPGARAEARELAALESIHPALVLSKERYDTAWHSYEKKVEKCLGESRRKLHGNPFEGLSLSAREIEVSAFVMAGRAMEACEIDELGHVAFEIGRFKAIAAHYGVSLPEWVDSDEQLLFAQRWRQLEKEADEYAAVGQEQRSQIEQHPDLQTPFDFVELLSRLRNSGATGQNQGTRTPVSKNDPSAHGVAPENGHQ